MSLFRCSWTNGGNAESWIVSIIGQRLPDECWSKKKAFWRSTCLVNISFRRSSLRVFYFLVICRSAHFIHWNYFLWSLWLWSIRFFYRCQTIYRISEFNKGNTTFGVFLSFLCGKSDSNEMELVPNGKLLDKLSIEWKSFSIRMCVRNSLRHLQCSGSVIFGILFCCSRGTIINLSKLHKSTTATHQITFATWEFTFETLCWSELPASCSFRFFSCSGWNRWKWHLWKNIS